MKNALAVANSLIDRGQLARVFGNPTSFENVVANEQQLNNSVASIASQPLTEAARVELQGIIQIAYLSDLPGRVSSDSKKMSPIFMRRPETASVVRQRQADSAGSRDHRCSKACRIQRAEPGRL